jgi:hypothetical protein
MNTAALWATTLSMFVVAVTSLARASDTPKKPQDGCALAAFNDYIKTNTALLTQAGPILTVEAQIAQRRLQEEFCARFVRCEDADPNGLPFRADFAKCLEDEALEQYDAVRRGGE